MLAFRLGKFKHEILELTPTEISDMLAFLEYEAELARKKSKKANKRN